MNDDALLSAVLSVVGSIASDVQTHAIALAGTDFVLLTDDRDEATTLLLEGIASTYGEVVASTCVRHDVNNRPLAGCLIRVEGDAATVAHQIRTAYVLATTDTGDDDPSTEGPF